MNVSFLLLVLSAICDTVWYISLGKSKGITDWGINILGAVFLVIGIFTFKKALLSMPLSIGVVLLTGLTLVFTIAFDIFYLKTKIDFKVAFFMVLCILSILALNYYSKQV